MRAAKVWVLCVLLGAGCSDSDAARGDRPDGGAASSDASGGGSASCGDAKIDVDEECDDGNAIDGDGCDRDCAFSCTEGSCADGEVCVEHGGPGDALRSCDCAPGYERGEAGCVMCPKGYVSDGVTCIDEDGCEVASCGEHRTCADREPPLTGYDCNCDAGFVDVEGVCVDNDACEGMPCGPSAQCADEPAPSTGFACTCDANATLGRAGGCQLDRQVTVSAAVNLSEVSLSGRDCADGGDAVHYSVVALTDTSVTLAKAPAAGCVSAGDLFALINLQGSPSKTANVGRYEWVTVASIADATVTFGSPKTRRFGESANADDNIGQGAGQQRVAFVRVPTYQGLHIAAQGVLSVSGFDGHGGGALFLNVLGALENDGTLHTNGRGYSGGVGGGELAGGYRGVSLDGVSVQNTATGADRIGAAHLGGGGGGGRHQELSNPYRQTWCGSGAGGGYLNTGGAGEAGETYNWQNGDPTYSNGSVGGASYGTDFHERLYLGSGGGGGAGFSNASGGPGGAGGGILFVRATVVSNVGIISSDGSPGGESNPSNSFGAGRGGGGAGGSVVLDASELEPEGTVRAAGGTVASSVGSLGGVGSVGRVSVVK